MCAQAAPRDGDNNVFNQQDVQAALWFLQAQSVRHPDGTLTCCLRVLFQWPLQVPADYLTVTPIETGWTGGCSDFDNAQVRTSAVSHPCGNSLVHTAIQCRYVPLTPHKPLHSVSLYWHLSPMRHVCTAPHQQAYYMCTPNSIGNPDGLMCTQWLVPGG